MSKSVIVTKRLMDIIIAFTVLSLFLPFILVIAILIKLDSKGPIFFLQSRMGMTKGDEPNPFYDNFFMIKFRTMRTEVSDTNGEKGDVFLENDTRVTKIGHFLRKTRLDELPNLINVLHGEMSIIGPRAGLYSAMKEVHDEFPLIFNRIKYCKPGITGLAQIHLRSNGDMNGNTELPLVLPEHDKDKPVLSFRYKMYYDFAYQMQLTNFWTFLKTDVMILLKTPIIMFFKHNTI